MIKNCCFFGHESLPVTWVIELKVMHEIEDLIQEGVADFYAGSLVGWDIICAKAVIRLRKVYPHIKLHLFLPRYNRFKVNGWDSNQKNDYNEILSDKEGVEIQHWSGSATKLNKKLVELSDYCICYYDKNITASRTSQAILMAQEKGLKIINLWVMYRNYSV